MMNLIQYLAALGVVVLSAEAGECLCWLRVYFVWVWIAGFVLGIRTVAYQRITESFAFYSILCRPRRRWSMQRTLGVVDQPIPLHGE